MNNLTVILGAGFSKPADLPLANEISHYFTRDNAHNVLSFGSAEKAWFDFANEAYRNNGRMHGDYLMWGHVLNQLVKEFIQVKGSFSNYEDFYQFCMDIVGDRAKVDDIFHKAQKSGEVERYFSPHNPNYVDNISCFKNAQRKEVKSLINHLIGDLLYIRKPWDEVEEEFISFMYIR